MTANIVDYVSSLPIRDLRAHVSVGNVEAWIVDLTSISGTTRDRTIVAACHGISLRCQDPKLATMTVAKLQEGIGRLARRLSPLAWDRLAAMSQPCDDVVRVVDDTGGVDSGWRHASLAERLGVTVEFVQSASADGPRVTDRACPTEW